MRLALATLSAAICAVSTAAGAMDAVSTIAGGKATLARHCGRCHALDALSPSPFDKAPPFREVYAKFPAGELRIRLSEGVVSHFKDMPQIDFTDEEITGILDYLSTLPQVRSP
jgi:cytochrome c